MAVQQNKKSRSRKGMRRSHQFVHMPNVIYCRCGEPTLSHCVCPKCGAYRGRTVVVQRVKTKKDREAS
jgi:large subunit ribosomal protein L32